MGRIDFSEETQKQIINFYNEVLDDVNGRTLKCIGEMKPVAERTRYKPIAQMLNSIIDFYNNDVINNIKGSVGKWIESEHSLSKAIEDFNAGEESIESARKLEANLHYLVEDMLSEQEKIDETKGYEAPNVGVQDLDEFVEKIGEYKSTMDELLETSTSRLRSMIDENELVNIMEPVLNSTINPIIASFDKISKDANEYISSGFTEQLNKFREKMAEAKSQSVKSSEEIAGFTTGINQAMKSLFGKRGI